MRRKMTNRESGRMEVGRASKQGDVLAFSVAETANVLGLSTRSIHRLIASDSLRSVKAGRRRLIPRESIAKMLNGPGEWQRNSSHEKTTRNYP